MPVSPLGFAFFAVAALTLGLVEIGVLDYAYERIGIDPHVFGALLFLSFLGSVVNVPVARLDGGAGPAPGGEAAAAAPAVDVGSRRSSASRETLLAVNLGGAVVPTLLSLYLVATRGLWLPAILATGVVAAVTHRLARPVAGVGIAVPVLAPPFIAAAAAFLLAPAAAPALAYAAGTVGTLVGADLSNLGRLRTLGAHVVSIGGAGTFDGVFLTGVIAVLLA
ncbi:MAG TPA: DUF1614 domain-containing protein [Candidatus Binatia bacterium]|nr:DUF1614 domain-containing protein [Candidatus Binatia bacterium]